MSKGSTGRNKHVLGNDGQLCTIYANVMVHRISMLLEVATACGLDWIVEQPRSSTMHKHPAWEKMVEHHAKNGTQVEKTNVCLGEYGARTPKDLKLFHTAKWVILSGNAF
eukprot:15239111-Alexandrium_andersonii.AAC.1